MVVTVTPKCSTIEAIRYDGTNEVAIQARLMELSPLYSLRLCRDVPYTEGQTVDWPHFLQFTSQEMFPQAGHFQKIETIKIGDWFFIKDGQPKTLPDNEFRAMFHVPDMVTV